MKTIKMPGFAAEASIYNTRNYYSMSGHLNKESNTIRQNIILPSLRMNSPIPCQFTEAGCGWFGDGGTDGGTGGGGGGGGDGGTGCTICDVAWECKLDGSPCKLVPYNCRPIPC